MKHIFLLFALLTSLCAFSQFPVTSRFSLSADTVTMEEYKPADDLSDAFKKVKLKVNYGDFEILNPKDVNRIRNANIAVIDLVYTVFPKDQDFKELNRQRLEYLHLICPELFNRPVIRWRAVGLTKCSSDYEASQMFHGFVIYYLPGPTLESARAEFDFLKRAAGGKERLTDSTIFKIFKRNKWKDCAVVADFTGSMSPYIAQLLMWYGLTFTQNLYTDFTFFNDGDRTDDATKRIGATGGIYYCKSGNQDTVLNAALSCVKGGFGGDCQENNIEALLYTIKKNPKLKEIILIVDNWAPMRDYALIDKVKIPVRVIVCGYGQNPYLNLQYLELAYRTKGSLHTMEQDIDKLMNLSDGKTVKVGNEEFKLSGGHMYKISKS